MRRTRCGGTVRTLCTGGVGESIDFSTDDSILEIADGSMWRRLMRYGSKSNYLLGAANSQSAIPDNGSEGEVQVRRLLASASGDNASD